VGRCWDRDLPNVAMSAATATSGHRVRIGGRRCRSHCQRYIVQSALGLSPHSDANMRSGWMRTRNDMLGNLAVLLAALGVFLPRCHCMVRLSRPGSH
jgi:hypothetical protein